MTPEPLALSGGVLAFLGVAALATFALAHVYRRVWLARCRTGRTPTGFGVLLPVVLLMTSVLVRAPIALVAALAIIAFGTALYWLDDAIELRARVRLAISFIAGAAIGAVMLVGMGGLSPEKTILVCLVAGLLNLVLTNLVNFYDGADLNLATYIILTAALVLAFAPSHPYWAPVALACLAFTCPFAVLNRRPRTIYLGDAGSFAFASILTLMGTSFLLDRSSLPPEVAIPSALPALDVFYVFTIRVIEKHDLLTRNWLHLYQRLNLRFAGFGYLLPQLINTALCLAAAVLLQWAGVDPLAAVVVAMIAVTVSFYFAFRRIFVPQGSVPDPQAMP